MAPKVCFISPEYWPLTGGTGSYVYYLSNELLKNGYPKSERAAERGDANAAEWVGEFRDIGKRLSVRTG